MANQSDTSTKEPTTSSEISCCRHGCPKIYHPIPFLITACLHFLILVAAGSYFGGVVSTLEKQFQFDSQMSGIIGIVSDASNFSVVLFVSYYGTKSNQPRIIGIGAIVSSLGYFCCAVPHFFNDLYQYKGTGAFEQTNNHHLCNDTLTNSSYVELSGSTGVQRDNAGIGWLIIGNLLIGLGSSPMFPLTLTYLDDSTVDHSTISIYIACFMSMTAVGPLLGFFTSFKCLSLYVDFYRVGVEDQPSEFWDPSWLGAWWLGYILASVAILILAIPMFFFPRHLSKYDCAACSRRNVDDGRNGKSPMAMVSFLKFDDASSAFQVISGFFKAVGRLVKNPVLAFSFCMNICDMAIIGGFIFFVAKYIQLQFDVSPATASIIVGLTTTPGNIFANIISGFIVKKFNLKLRGLSIMLAIVCTLAALFAIPVLFIGCPNPQIAGVAMQYGNQNELNVATVIETCNTGCSCASGIYKPVCGSDGVTYQSPCHAGCTITTNGDGIFNDTGKMIFSHCSCTEETHINGDVIATATEGACRFLCNKSIQFSVLIGIITMFASLRTNPSLLTVLRCVDEVDKGLAMGYHSLLIRALGFLPASLYFGAVISSTCIFRQETESGNGACLIYDLEKYRYGFIGLFLGLKVTGAIFAFCIFLSVKYWKIPKNTKVEQVRELADKQPTFALTTDIIETVP